MEATLPACGNPKCGASTGVHEGLTFGSGILDSLGFWSKPCRKRAADHDARRTEIIFSMMADAAKCNQTEYMEKYIQQSEWLRYPAWPMEMGYLQEV